MITQIKEGYDFIHIAVAVVDGDGKAVDPSAAEAWFYKVSQSDGSISLDTNIDSDGKVALAKQAGETGFYGGAIATSALSANEYVVLYKVTIDGIESITVEFFSIDLSKKVIHEIKPETDKIPGMKTETDKIPAVKIGTDKIPSIKAETDKIQPRIIEKKDEFKADTSALSLESSVQAIKKTLIFIKNIEGGYWKVKDNQMIFYKEDNTTEIARFDLFDKDGNPSMENVYERKRV